MADVFPKIFRLAAVFFYDVGLEPFTAFALANRILLYFTSPSLLVFAFLSFPIIRLSFLHHSKHHSL